MIGVSRLTTVLTTALIGATIVMTQTAAAAPDAATDRQIDPRVRTFLAEHGSPFFWELLPGSQVRAISTGLQAKTPVDLSGVTIAEKTITEHGRNIKLYIVKPEKADGLLCRSRTGGFSRPDQREPRAGEARRHRDHPARRPL